MSQPGPETWYALAATLGLAALACALIALFKDRSRGRRRCPTCWYNMSGIAGTVCPECGHDARREKRLFKGRLLRKWATVAVLLGAASYASLRMPDLRAAGWMSLVPTTIVVLYAPAKPSPVSGSTAITFSEHCESALLGRFTSGRFWRWQSSLYIRRCIAAMDSHPDTWVRLPEQWPRDQALRVDPRCASLWLGFSEGRTPEGLWKSEHFTLPPHSQPPEIPVRIIFSGHVLYETIARPPIRLTSPATQPSDALQEPPAPTTGPSGEILWHSGRHTP